MASKNLKPILINRKIRKTSSSKNVNVGKNYQETMLFSNNLNVENEMKLLQQNNDSYSALSNYYSKKDNNSHFFEKISIFNKKFYKCSEKYLIAKTNLEKINDDLYLNLFKQIDCYVEEIQRLNKKICDSDKSTDYQKTIKNLNKEILENKNEIRNLEAKLTKKNTNEEKLLKEIESYKRRIIFYKDKIKINLGMRQNNMINYTNTHKNNNNQSCKKDINDIKTKKTFDYKLREFFSPSPQIRNYHYVNNNSNFHSEYFSRTHQNYYLNSYNTVLHNRENGAKILSPLASDINMYSDNDTDNNNDNINSTIKLNKNYNFKESIIVRSKVVSPPILTAMCSRKLENIGEENKDTLESINNEKKNKNNYSPFRKNDQDENNDKSNKTNPNNFYFTDNEDEIIKPTNKKIYKIDNLKDINTTQKKEKKEKKDILTDSNCIRNKLKWKNSQKNIRTKKKFLPQKKLLDFTNSRKTNKTLDDFSKLEKNKMTENKDKISEFKENITKKFSDQIPDDFNLNGNKTNSKIRLKKNVSTMGIIEKKIMNKNITSEIKKVYINNRNENMNKNGINIDHSAQLISKPTTTTYRKKSEKKIINNKNDKELFKILSEVNDDYNNNIEMLNRQEEQIKLMLSLIDN